MAQPDAASSKKFDLRSHQDDSLYFTGMSGKFRAIHFPAIPIWPWAGFPLMEIFTISISMANIGVLFNTQERPEASFGASYFGGERPQLLDVIKVDPDSGYQVIPTDGTL
ncbi:MAG: hypothetical protein QM813_15705 [Verrucomicrobiota bacterium]